MTPASLKRTLGAVMPDAAVITPISTGGPNQLVVQNLTAYYGSSQILFGLDFQVPQGQIVALLGRNGAGKTTCFKALMGLVRREGRIDLTGQDVSAMPTWRLARAGLGYVPEDRQVFPQHSVEENLGIGAKPGARGTTERWTLAEIYAAFPLLARLRNRAAGLLSGGEQQMLSIGRTLMGNPSVLLLDEPSEGLAPLIVAEIGKLLQRLREMGQTVLISEQNTRFCLDAATRVIVLDKGQIVFTGEKQSFVSDPGIQLRYLAA